MGYLKLLLFLLVANSCFSQSVEEQEIRSILHRQTLNWNKGDVTSFMQGYWKSDSLMFIGKSGVTYGYDNTLQNYKRNYPDAAHMGKLSFQIIKVEKLDASNYFVVGKWMLKRTVGDVSGHYTLLFRKINGQWVIVADHSS